MPISDILNAIWGKPTTSCITLADQLAWLNNYHPTLKLQTTENESPYPLLPLNQWFPQHLHQAITQFGEKNNVNHNASASMWLKSFNNNFITSLTALRLKFNRVPIIQFNDILIATSNGDKIAHLQLNANCPFVCLPSDPLASHTQASVVESQQQLDDAFQQQLHQIGSALAHLFEKEKLRSRPFWGSLSFAISILFMRITEQGISHELVATLKAQAQQWLNNVTPEAGKGLAQIQIAENSEQAILYIQRETCCMKYKIEGKSNCSTCQLLDDNERHAKNIKRIPHVNKQ